MRGRPAVIVVLSVLLVAAIGVAWKVRSRLPAPLPDDTAPTAPGARTAKTLDQRWRSPDLDGAIYARPVVVRDLVLVATENSSLYGLDRGDGHIVWGPTNVGAPATISELERLGKPEGCGNIDPLGITGAPGVDEATGTAFAVAEVLPGGDRQPQHLFVGVDAATGRLRFPPFPIDPPGADPKVLQQRPALAVANGQVYVGFGGLAGDCGDYHGWLVAVPTSGTGAPRYYEVAPTPEGNRGGAIWSTAGPSIDAKGNVFVATGNSFEPPPDPAFDRGDAVIELTPTLDEVGYFAPSTFREDNDADADLGSTSPLLLPGDLVFQIGKGGKGYLVSTTRPGGNPLGGIGGEVASADICPAYGGSAYRAPMILVACTSGMHGVELDTSVSPPALRVRWRAQVDATGPVVVDGDVAWAGDPAHQAIFALDARTGQVRGQRDRLGSMTRFTTPTVADGTVYVASGKGINALDARIT